MSLFKVVVLASITAAYGCSNEDLVNTKLHQTIALQKHTSGFAAACKGKLSMKSEYTGDVEIPAITSISCDDMDKKSEFFSPLSEADIEALEEQIKKINNVE
ncbi:hypothetical protein [Bacterioplanoides sp.]|uniref:hypothetical protein n=1 Tax=Bacterioplanoides sp. TaxID=2066072 RepID=UPI003B5AB969